jgi:glycosyltransferase involved in cell wall biosynthesis
MPQKPEYVYIAFDVFPSQKGAATHINHCLKALQQTYTNGLLICLGNDDMPAFQFDKERNLYVYRWKEKVFNFLERTQKFQDNILEILQLPLCESIKLAHFRDIWGGISILKSNLQVKTVFEINAFPHIELPNRYPNISETVLEKIENMEQFCITNCNTIITPSQVTKGYIQNYFNIETDKINVIPNGVKIYNENPSSKTNPLPHSYILYFGALQKWQGIKTLLKALRELDDLDIRLLICASVQKKRTLIYHELAEDFGVNHKIDWLYELNKEELVVKIKNAKLTVAPLSECNRNITQGCSPLKILESMAYGTPVVASRIPVVAELITDNNTGYLVPPDRPETLGRKIRTLLDDTNQ